MPRIKKAQMQVITASPYRVLKSVGAKGDFGHFPSSEQYADGCIWLARYDFLLVFYSDLGLDGTFVSAVSC